MVAGPIPTPDAGDVDWRSWLEHTPTPTCCLEPPQPIAAGNDAALLEGVSRFRIVACSRSFADLAGSRHDRDLLLTGVSDLPPALSFSLVEALHAALLPARGVRPPDPARTAPLGSPSLPPESPRWRIAPEWRDGNLRRVWVFEREGTPGLLATGANDQLLRAVLSTSVSAIVVLATSGQIVYANDRAEQILGLQRADILSRSYDAPAWKITDVDGAPWPDEKQPFVRVMRTGEPVFGVQHAIEWPSGERKILSINGAPMKDSEGRVTNVVFSVDDVTARSEAERTLTASRARLADIIARVQHGIVVHGRDEAILVANSAAGVLLGVAQSELTGLDSWDPRWQPIREDGTLLPPHELPSPRALATGQPVHDMVVGIWNPVRERHRWLQISAIPSLDDEGAVRDVVVSFSDVSEIKEARDALNEKSEWLHLALSSGRLGIWSWDARNNMVRWSPELYEMYGVDPATFSGRVEDVVQLIHPDEREGFRQHARRAIDGGERDFLTIHRVLRPDGGERWIESHARIYRDDEQRFVRMTGTAQDITERRTLETQLAQTARVESIGRLAGGVAHDFNNILTVILGVAQLGEQMAGPGDPAREEFQLITDAARRGAALTRQLLAFARREVVEPRLLSLNFIVESTAAMLPRLLGEDVALELQLQPDLSPILVDQAQFESIVINLAVNARDAMPRGGRLRLATHALRIPDGTAGIGTNLPDGDYLVLEVHDTGTGIAPEIVGRIFEPFFTTKDVGRGTGLGLSMCRDIMQQVGGAITVDSRLGEGTTFRLIIPRAIVSPGDASPLREAAAEHVQRRLHGTALLAEDEATIRHLMLQILRREGLTVLEARDGVEAMIMAREYPGTIDLLITDVVMPRLGGIDLARQLCSHRAGLRVLFTTGYADRPLSAEGLHEDVVHVLHKPFAMDELLTRVSELLGSGTR